MDEKLLEARLDFLIRQLHLAADVKVKIETNRAGNGIWDSGEPMEAIKKLYLATLKTYGGPDAEK